MNQIYRVGLCAGLWLGMAVSGLAQERLIESYLLQGKIPEARAAVESALKAQPGSDELTLQLAITQFLGSVEQFSQSMYRYGLDPSTFGGMIPFLRFPSAPNPRAEEVTNADVRRVFAELVTGLGVASKTLSTIEDSSKVKVPVRLGMIRLDLDGDGLASPRETLWSIYDELNPGTGWTEERGRKLGAHFDVADVRWLEGYCHLLTAMLETGLTYDTEELFNHTAQLFFRNPKIPYDFLKTAESDSIFTFVDAIAFLHLIDLPVADAARSRSALANFEQVTALSRRSWTCIMAETDDDYEWIPSPKQQSVLPASPVTAEMVKAWQDFLDEADRILAGTTLLPFWRGNPPTVEGKPAPVGTRGVNLRRVFTEPTRLDAVLWVQGTAAVPYLQEGTVTSPAFWNSLDAAFRGNFLGYAVWIN